MMIISLSPTVPEGLVKSTIVEVREGKTRQTAYGSTATMLTGFELDNGEKVYQSILIFNGSKLLNQLITSTLETAIQEIDVNNFIGKRCVIEIKHNIVNGTTYANVVGIHTIDKIEEIEKNTEEKADTE